MFVGHGLLAFALVASVARWRGAARDRALAVGLLAAGFATIPDVDVVHPLVSLLVDPVRPAATADAFWALSTELHRTVTHSLVVGGIVAAAITGVVAGRPTSGAGTPTGSSGLCAAGERPVGGLLAMAGLVGLVGFIDGPAAGGVLAAMVIAGLALAVVAVRHGLGARAVGLAATVGLATHPFGDLFTGQAPPLLYPLPADLGLTRIALHADPTVHLVGAFLLELGTVWLALAVLAQLWDVRLRAQVSPRAVAGVVYAGAILLLPAPTLDAATGFVFSVLAVGLVGVPARWRSRHAWRAVGTGLAAITLAALAYVLAYLVV